MTSLFWRTTETAVPEFFGTFLFTLFGGASSSVATGAGLNGAFGNAIALTAVLYMLSNDEGSGKLNSAVSLAIYLSDANVGGILKMLMEVTMQILGALAAGAALKQLMPHPHDSCFHPTVSNSALFAWELLGTFLLIGVIFSTSGNRYLVVAPLAIGLALFAAAQAAGPFTGGCFNPARYLANAGAGCSVGKAGYYIGAQVVAAVAVFVVHYVQRLLLVQRLPDEQRVQAPRARDEDDYPQEFARRRRASRYDDDEA